MPLKVVLLQLNCLFPKTKNGQGLQSVFPVRRPTLPSQVVLKWNYAAQPVPTQTLSLSATLGSQPGTSGK